jgi:RNA polymerase sigma-70 factor (ECF subfamily)
MNNNAFVKIYLDQKLKIFSYLLYKTKSKSVAEDITSDVFLKLFKELQVNKKVLEYAVPWLYRVANNKLIDQQRSSFYSKTSVESEISEKKSAQLEESVEVDVFVAEYTDILEVISKDEQQKQLLEVMETLRDEDREIVDLRTFQELPFKQIAVILESTEVAVKMKYARAIEKLKKLYGEKYEK